MVCINPELFILFTLLFKLVPLIFTRAGNNAMHLQTIRAEPTYENRMMDNPDNDVDNNYCGLNMNTDNDHTYSVSN